ncbi:MAG TPA: phage baseplate assembly protein V, partial [Anaerolineaceae bacterium]|nr:phage baseplate assembly protein V [Anaerolineaceae bacterium]
MRTIKQLQIVISGGLEIEHVLSLFISQKVNWHHTFDISVRNDDMRGNFEDCLGKPIHIEFKESIEDKTFENTFSGVITEVARSCDAISGETILLRGKSPSFYLEGPTTYRSFLDTDLRKAVDEIFRAYPTDKFSSRIAPTVNPQISYIIQYRESDFHFLSRIAEHWGQWFYFNGIDLYFGRRAPDPEVELQFNKTLSRADLELRLLPAKMTNYAYEYIKNETYQYDSAKADVSDPGKFAKKALAESERLLLPGIAPLERRILEKSELENEMLINKTAQVGSMIMLLGTSDNPALRAGQAIAITGTAGLDGKYIIHSVSHQLDTSGNYENTFEAVPASITAPPPNPYIAEPLTTPQIATVIDNKDPEKLGRIKVRFIWDQQPTTWLRVVTPHAGPDRGNYFIPEVDDQVLVGFEFNNPDCPYVIG